MDALIRGRGALGPVGAYSITATKWKPFRKPIRRIGATHPEFGEMLARARELQAENIADEVVDIADDGQNDWMDRETVKGVIREHVQRSRLRVNTRLCLLKSLSPDFVASCRPHRADIRKDP